MQQVYACEFGPKEVEKVFNTEMSKEEKDAYMKRLKLQRDHIKKGYGRIQGKIMEIRQNFSSAVVSGRRSGSGKIVLQHYDRLAQIYGGTASSEPILAGVDTDTFNCANQNELITTDEILDEDSLVDVSNDESSAPVNK